MAKEFVSLLHFFLSFFLSFFGFILPSNGLLLLFKDFHTFHVPIRGTKRVFRILFILA